MIVCGKCGGVIEKDPKLGDLEMALEEGLKKTGMSRLCMKCLEKMLAERKSQPAPEVFQRPTKYQFTPEMREISGFGAGYEQTCRNMLSAGLEWLDEHPKADPKFQGYKNVVGILMEDNDDAKALSAAAVAASGNDCTGAMHQAVISHCLWIRKNGWDRFVAEFREEEAKSGNSPKTDQADAAPGNS